MHQHLRISKTVVASFDRKPTPETLAMVSKLAQTAESFFNQTNTKMKKQILTDEELKFLGFQRSFRPNIKTDTEVIDEVQFNHPNLVMGLGYNIELEPGTQVIKQHYFILSIHGESVILEEPITAQELKQMVTVLKFRPNGTGN